MQNFPHKDEYTNLWNNMNISNDRVDEFQKAAQKILNHKALYQVISSKTNVPWDVIGLIHLRESGCDFTTHLHNGDPLSAKTVHEPKGRPLTGTPPFSFEYSAIDALQYDGLDKVTDWSIELRAYYFEKFNGFGYRQYHVNSPYLWGGTDQYVKGKYVADHDFSNVVVDKQLGAMGVLKTLMQLDPEFGTVKNNVEEIIPDSSYKATPNTSTVVLNTISRKYKLLTIVSHWLKALFLSIFGTVTTALYSTDIPTAKSYLEQAKEFWTNYGPVGALVFIAVGIAAISKIRSYVQDDMKSGRYMPSGLQK